MVAPRRLLEGIQYRQSRYVRGVASRHFVGLPSWRQVPLKRSRDDLISDSEEEDTMAANQKRTSFGKQKALVDYGLVLSLFPIKLERQG